MVYWRTSPERDILLEDKLNRKNKKGSLVPLGKSGLQSCVKSAGCQALTRENSVGKRAT